MARSSIMLRDIGDDGLFVTANFNSDELEIGTNNIDLQFLKEMEVSNRFILSREQRIKLQKFLNSSWPEEDQYND